MTKHILAFVLLVASAFATTVTGTTKDPSTGNLFNGSISFSLNYNGARQISTNQVLITPRPAPQYSVTNGAIPSGLTVVGNDDISPVKTVYLVAWFDPNGALLRVSPYSITGTTFDLGTAIPTPITTSNVSVLDLIGLRTLSATGLAQFGSIVVTGNTNLATTSGRVAIGTALTPQGQLSNLPATSQMLDAVGTGQSGTPFIWNSATAGYSVQIINQGGSSNANGLLLKTTTQTGRIFTANFGALAAGRDMWFVTGNGVSNNGYGHKHQRLSFNSINGNFDASLTWTTAFADTNYTVACTVLDGTFIKTNEVMIGKTTATVTVRVTAGAIGPMVLNCIADHDE